MPWGEWTRGLGLLLVALALGTALGPDWPMSAAEFERLGQRWPIDPQPAGVVADVPSRFGWQWRGEPASFDVVLLDQELAELAVVPVGAAVSWTPGPELRARLRALGRFYWVVRAHTRRGVTTSAPIALLLRG